MTPEQLTQLQNAVHELDDAYWNHQDAKFAESLAAIVDISTTEQDRLAAESSRWGG